MAEIYNRFNLSGNPAQNVTKMQTVIIYDEMIICWKSIWKSFLNLIENLLGIFLIKFSIGNMVQNFKIFACFFM